MDHLLRNRKDEASRSIAILCISVLHSGGDCDHISLEIDCWSATKAWIDWSIDAIVGQRCSEISAEESHENIFLAYRSD